jgi:hypothetical protein
MLEAERAAAEKKLDTFRPPQKLVVHPNIAGLYRQQVERLEEALQEPEARAAAAEAIRSLIERIVLTQNGENLEAKLYGDLVEILAFSERGERTAKDPISGEAGSLLSVVAGKRNHLYRTELFIGR